MTNQQRLELIEKYIRENKYADLQTLADKFDTSQSTVRRALNELESRGIVRRHHGGASLVQEDTSTGGYDFITQDDRNVPSKRAIAREIASRVQDGMTVILDGGTSTYAVARQLVQKRLVIMTNSLPIAALFGEIGTCETIVTGGTVYNRLGILYGPACEQSLETCHADLAIMGAAGLTEEGIWNNNNFVVSVQKKMMNAADSTIFTLDSSKFGKRAMNITTPYKESVTVVTDRAPDPLFTDAIRNGGAAIVVSED